MEATYRRPPWLTGSYHTRRPLLAKKGRKRLLCPTCRMECAVKGGRAAELPTNWGMMGT